MRMLLTGIKRFSLQKWNDVSLRCLRQTNHLRLLKRTLSSSTELQTSTYDKGTLPNDKEVQDAQPNEPESQESDDSLAEFYTDRNNKRRDQAKHSYRPMIDPKETSILLFPGQGSQFVGMAKVLLPYPGVQDIFDVASEILGYNLLDICLKGPAQLLNKTIHCQPAVLATSLAAVERLKEENPKAIEQCIATAGFSVGEFAALVFAGSMDFEDAVRVVKVRAEAMQEASEMIPSGMMSAFLSADHKLGQACQLAKQYCMQKLGINDPVCNIANYLYPEAKVIAGNDQALAFIEKNGRDFGIRRTKRLPVSGAFHTDLMRPAIEPLVEALKNVDFKRPIIPVHCNVTSHAYGRRQPIARTLVEQLYKPVKWEQTLHVMYSRKQGTDFPFTFELGPGKQLGAMLKMTNFKAHTQYRAVEV